MGDLAGSGPAGKMSLARTVAVVERGGAQAFGVADSCLSPPPFPSSRHQPNQVLQRSLQHSSWLWLGLFIAEAILRRTSLNVNTWVLASRTQQIHFLDVRLDLWQSKVFFLFFCPSIIISSSLVGEQQGGKSAKGEYNWPFQNSTCTVDRTRSA